MPINFSVCCDCGSDTTETRKRITAVVAGQTTAYNIDPAGSATFTACDKPDTVECVVTSQPNGVTGAIGDSVNFGGACSCGTMVWQTLVNGTWSTAVEPNTITQSNIGTIWRFCCDGDTENCSNSVSIVEEVIECVVVTEPTSVVGNPGDSVNFGGACSCGTMVWQTLVNGVWVNATPPATISQTDFGTFWRFCCDGDPNNCSNPVTIIEEGIPIDPAFWTNTPGSGPDGGEKCATCVNGTITNIDWRPVDPITGQGVGTWQDTGMI